MMLDNIRVFNNDDFFKITSIANKIKFLLRYAILAPSTHNSQPWLFQIGNNSVKIFYNPEAYNIKEGDPTGRDMYISFGCLIENLIIAGQYFRVFDKIQYIYDSSKNFIAEIFFKNLDGAKEPDKSFENLIKEIPKRVNVRGLFEKKSVNPEIISQLKQVNTFNRIRLDVVEEKAMIQKLAEFTRQGLEMAYANKNFRKEISGWIRNNFSKKQDGIPGYSLRMPALISIIFPWLVRNFNIGKKVGFLNYISINSAPSVAIISAQDESPITWLDMGRLAERLMLQARVFGMKTSIFVAAIEMGELYKEIQKLLNISLRPQFLMCIGYMNFEQKPNLRHSVEEKLVN